MSAERIMRWAAAAYTLELDLDRGRMLLTASAGPVVEAPLGTSISARRSGPGRIRLVDGVRRAAPGGALFELRYDGERSGTFIVRCAEDRLYLCDRPDADLEEVDLLGFLSGCGGGSPAGRIGAAELYVPRFDWSQGMVLRSPSDRDSLACQQWLSPPPFCYALRVGVEWIGCGAAARDGEWNFQSFDYDGESGPRFSLDFDGHGRFPGGQETPALLFVFGASDPNGAVAAYVEALRTDGYLRKSERRSREWWREPIFCGWGEQRLQFRRRHGGGECGNWINAGDLATERLYQQSLAALESRGIEPGTVVVDCFWSERPCLAEPDPLKWRDLRGFIDAQHALGRKVLLWITPIIFAGVPEEGCMTLDGRPIATDPTSAAFRIFFAEQIRLMVGDGPGCLNADGFKVDFTQNIPAERQLFRSLLSDKWAIITEDESKRYPALSEGRSSLIRSARPLWGAELVKSYIDAIAEPLKAYKADSLLICHAANPYIMPSFDMLRLNDMDGSSPDVLGIMGNRAAIVRACDRDILIDTDNDLMVSKAMWRSYIELQERIGVPDTYYATGIAASNESFDAQDYDLLRTAWARYRRREGLRPRR